MGCLWLRLEPLYLFTVAAVEDPGRKKESLGKVEEELSNEVTTAIPTKAASPIGGPSWYVQKNEQLKG